MNADCAYARHDEVSVEIAAQPQALFDYLDDQERLAAHMNRPSLMMAGGRMAYAFDAARGRAVGSLIRMSGAFLGVPLFVEEVVTERERPWLKIWETRGVPRLLIIGGYRMGFEINDSKGMSRLRVFIDYDLPRSFVGRLLGLVFAPAYARWCVERMAKDAQRGFALSVMHVAARWPT